MGVRISYTSTCISVARMENTRLVPSPVPKMPFGMSIFAPLSYSFFRPENIIYAPCGINMTDILLDILLKIDQGLISLQSRNPL